MREGDRLAVGRPVEVDDASASPRRQQLRRRACRPRPFRPARRTGGSSSRSRRCVRQSRFSLSAFSSSSVLAVAHEEARSTLPSGDQSNAPTPPFSSVIISASPPAGLIRQTLALPLREREEAEPLAVGRPARRGRRLLAARQLPAARSVGACHVDVAQPLALLAVHDRLADDEGDAAAVGRRRHRGHTTDFHHRLDGPAALVGALKRGGTNVIATAMQAANARVRVMSRSSWSGLYLCRMDEGKGQTDVVASVTAGLVGVRQVGCRRRSSQLT